jgi:alcohol dehydrogenase
METSSSVNHGSRRRRWHPYYGAAVDLTGMLVENGALRRPQYAPLGSGSGSFAEAAIAQAGTIGAKPRNLSHTESAALPLAGVAALQALTENLRVSPGQKVLIHGGAGGIGSFAVQLAKHLGARVATTVSARDVDYAKALGADTVVDYKSQKFEEVLRDLDAILDTVGGDTYTRSFKPLKKGGRLG